MARRTKAKGSLLSSEEKIYSVFAYFGVLCLVSLLVKRDNEYVMFHVRQGLVLFIIETIFGILQVVPLLGYFAFVLVLLICGLLSLIGMVQAIMGNKWNMPVIGEWAKKITI